MTELRAPIPLNELPLRFTFTSDAKWQQSWRQVGWWNTKTFEVRDMDAQALGPGWTELWILAIEDKR
jgi:hypothetical protein